jgi:hypothetical protein
VGVLVVTIEGAWGCAVSCCERVVPRANVVGVLVAIIEVQWYLEKIKNVKARSSIEH